MERTNRGFSKFTFENYEGESIIIQESSNATENCIWLGAENLRLIRWENPYAKGKYTTLTEEELQFFQGNESLEYSREDIKKILPLLEQFAETGTIDIKHEEQSKHKYYDELGNPEGLALCGQIFGSYADYFCYEKPYQAFHAVVDGCMCYCFDVKAESVNARWRSAFPTWQLDLAEKGYWPCLEKYGWKPKEQ